MKRPFPPPPSLNPILLTEAILHLLQKTPTDVRETKYYYSGNILNSLLAEFFRARRLPEMTRRAIITTIAAQGNYPPGHNLGMEAFTNMQHRLRLLLETETLWT